MLLENQEGTPRRLVWIETQNFAGWRCSECDWVFRPAGPPIGKNLNEMKANFLKQLIEKFTIHTCLTSRGWANRFSS
jgi:hypothetical protein